jgi:hypothetical protein
LNKQYEERQKQVLLELKETKEQLLQNLKNNSTSVDFGMNNEENLNGTNQDIDISVFLKMRLVSDEAWIHFQKAFGEVYPFYLDNLILLHPELSYADLRLIGLHRLNLDSQDVSVILGISKDSLRKSNQRLRNKLSFKEQSDLIEYIFTIPFDQPVVTP